METSHNNHMKSSSLLICAFLTVAGAIPASAALTFVIGSQAVTNPTLPNMPNVWPSSGGESPGNAIDGNLTNKYLNFAKNNTGYIYTTTGSTAAVVTGINFVSGNDAPLRDPSTYILYGSNTATASNVAGTIFDVDTAFTVISSGTVLLPDEGTTRGTTRTTFNTTFVNASPFSTYLLVFPTVKGSADPTVNSMQIGEARLQTASGALDNTGVIGGGQLVPEPGSASLLALLGLGLLARRRRAWDGGTTAGAAWPPTAVPAVAILPCLE